MDTNMPSTADVQLAADPAATEACGNWIGRRLSVGDVIALVGEVGAGKTTWTRGLARGLGLDDPDAVASPTYLLVVEHPGPVPLVHADAYLPEKLAGFLADGGLDYLADRRAVTVVEWGDRMRKWLPADALWITFETATTPGRRLRLQTAGDRFPWLRELPKIFDGC
ncbi:MAG: hypothetical protein RL398_3223 [Planctomycetota bacterium]|jgi:tRNA threonylcarbamoyladenosine biosynthesis protein TsaE